MWKQSFEDGPRPFQEQRNEEYLVQRMKVENPRLYRDYNDCKVNWIWCLITDENEPNATFIIEG